MLNNIDNSSNTASRLVQQDSLNSILGSNSRRNNKVTTVDSNFLIDSSDISKKAIQMYQRELDIKNFAQLVMSDPENDSHNKMMEELFAKGVVDVFEDSTIESIADNKSLLEDLGL